MHGKTMGECILDSKERGDDGKVWIGHEDLNIGFIGL